MPNRYTIKDMQAYATNKGGKCLSKEFINSESPLKWQCEKGHTWETDFQVIRQGGWCQQCINAQKKKEERLYEMKAIAKERGGKCLSEEYIDGKTNLLWECKEKHKWSAAPSNVKFGKTWCPYCIGNVRLSLQDMITIAAKKGGKCLSNEYINNHSKIKWECKEGHVWMATPHNVINSNSWCSKCIHAIIHENKKNDIEEFRSIALKHGGKLLSDIYISVHSHLLWKCEKGHEWKATPNSVKAGHWCPECAGVAKFTIEKMRKYAAKKNGKCLSDKYVNTITKLKWQCEKGHIWWTKPSTIVSGGSWCPVCFNKMKVKNLGVYSIKKSLRPDT